MLTMSKKKQRELLLAEREALIDELDSLYKRTFDRISTLKISERSIAKLTQIILLSRDSAIAPLREEIEQPLITRPST